MKWLQKSFRNIIGKFITVLETNNKVAVCDVIVLNKSNSENILGFSMCTELGLIKLNNDNNINKIESAKKKINKKLNSPRQKEKSQQSQNRLLMNIRHI